MTVLLILFMSALGRAALAPDTEIHLVATDGACANRLTFTGRLVKQSLRRQNARWGRAYHGAYQDLPAVLVHAGAGRTHAHEIAAAVRGVVGAIGTRPGTNYLLAAVRNLIDHEDLFVCVLSGECSISPAGSRLIYDQRALERTLMLPLPGPDAARIFALEFLDPFVAPTAAHLLQKWADALHRSGQTAGLARWTEDHEFDVVFETLFELYLTVDLERVLDGVNHNRAVREWAANAFHDLRASVAAQTLKKLRIDEPTMLRRSGEIINAVVAGANARR